MASVLIDVMNGRIDGSKVGHRLTAARLLIIYGYDDADDFIADNTPITSETDPDDRAWVIIDPDLTKLIRFKTDDGRAMCLFLIEVMQGKVEGIQRRTPRVGGQGASQSRIRQVSEQTTAQASRFDCATTLDSQDTPTCCIHSDPGSRHCPAESTVALDEPEPQPEHSIRGVEPIYIDGEPFYLESELVMTYEGCDDPDFDPYRAVHDEEYAQSYTCKNPECEVHGEPKEIDFDPNDYHY